MYVGESDFSEGILQGEIFEVLEVGADMGFKIRLSTGRSTIVYTLDFEKSRSIESYRIVPPLPKCTNDETELEPGDFMALMDFAIDIKAFDLAKEWHDVGQNLAI